MSKELPMHLMQVFGDCELVLADTPQGLQATVHDQGGIEYARVLDKAQLAVLAELVSNCQNRASKSNEQLWGASQLRRRFGLTRTELDALELLGLLDSCGLVDKATGESFYAGEAVAKYADGRQAIVNALLQSSKPMLTVDAHKYFSELAANVAMPPSSKDKLRQLLSALSGYAVLADKSYPLAEGYCLASLASGSCQRVPLRGKAGLLCRCRVDKAASTACWLLVAH